jgi:NAD(P)-dependent dehydrogenase (short-subunit alcohol dehydrogenase family)
VNVQWRVSVFSEKISRTQKGHANVDCKARNGGPAQLHESAQSPQLMQPKSAITNFTAASAELLAKQGHRLYSIAPGPIWTPLIPPAMPAEFARFADANLHTSWSAIRVDRN